MHTHTLALLCPALPCTKEITYSVNINLFANLRNYIEHMRFFLSKCLTWWLLFANSLISPIMNQLRNHNSSALGHTAYPDQSTIIKYGLGCVYCNAACYVLLSLQLLGRGYGYIVRVCVLHNAAIHTRPLFCNNALVWIGCAVCTPKLT